MNKKFNNRLEAFLFLLIRDHVLIGDVNKVLKDVVKDDEYYYDSPELIAWVRKKIEDLKV